MRKGIIYLHKNKISGRCYVGSTIQDPRKRWRKSDPTYNSYKSCPIFFRALNKYGWDNFETTILESDVLLEDMATREEFCIEEHKSLAPHGYNAVNIVEGLVEYSLKTRQKISNSKLGSTNVAWNKNEHIEVNGICHKLCTTCKNVKVLEDFGKYKSTWDGLNRKCKECHNAYRKKYSSKKLTETEIKKSYSQRRTTSRPFIAFDDNFNEILRFKSGVDASKGGYDKTSIRRSITKNKKYKGYWWKYEDETIYRVFARKCEIIEINTAQERLFLDKYHKQKYVASKIAYGLKFNGDIVCILTFGSPRFSKKYDWEIIRLCSKRNTIVVGGASRLFKHFLREVNPNNVLTYADREYSKKGDVYYKMGFNLIGQTPKGYKYQKEGNFLSRYQCQKSKLFKLLGNVYDPRLTEKQNMLDSGYEIVYDDGNNVFEWINPSTFVTY